MQRLTAASETTCCDAPFLQVRVIPIEARQFRVVGAGLGDAAIAARDNAETSELPTPSFKAFTLTFSRAMAAAVVTSLCLASSSALSSMWLWPRELGVTHGVCRHMLVRSSCTAHRKSTHRLC